jgi:hypothetical protein
MLDYIHFEALGHLSLLPLSTPRSSRSSCGREELPLTTDLPLPFTSESLLRGIFQKLQT